MEILNTKIQKYKNTLSGKRKLCCQAGDAKKCEGVTHFFQSITAVSINLTDSTYDNYKYRHYIKGNGTNRIEIDFFVA